MDNGFGTLDNGSLTADKNSMRPDNALSNCFMTPRKREIIMKGLLFYAADGGATSGSTNTSGTTTSSEPTKRKRGPFDKELLAEIRETEDVILAARREEWATILEDEQGIPPADVDALEDKLDQAASLLGISRTGTTQQSTHVETENAAEEAIVAAIHRIQTGVRRTFPTSRANQQRYFIGTNIEANEDDLTRIASSVLELLKTETLKGVGTKQITALKDALDAWKAAHQARGGQAITTGQDRQQGLKLLKEVGLLRRDIQIAADGEWPYTDPANSAVRRAFHLPEKRPFVVSLHE